MKNNVSRFLSISSIFILIQSICFFEHYTTPEELAKPCDCNRTTDSLALMELYHATQGENWKVQWDLSTSIDQWYGVTLNSKGCVTCLDLDGLHDCAFERGEGNGARGILPDLQLCALKGLYLHSNHIIKELPDFTGMPNLEALDVSFNLLKRQIPNFQHLPNLVLLDLDVNHLTGTLPNFDHLPKLEILFVSNNDIGGDLPSLDQCPRLRHLLVQNNAFTGNIPHLSHAKHLKVLQMDNCNFDGVLPSFNEHQKLEFLSLSQNKIEGNLELIKGAKNLKWLNLNDNAFKGEINSLNDLKKIISVNLANNEFSGMIPDLSAFDNLQNAYFKNNHFDALAPVRYSDRPLNLNLNNNRLQFSDLESFVAYLPTENKYSVQAPEIVDTTLYVADGKECVLQVQDVHPNNTYSWYHGGVFIDEFIGVAELVISDFALEQGGVYECIVTNSNFPDMKYLGGQFMLKPNWDRTDVADGQKVAGDDKFLIWNHNNKFEASITNNDLIEDVNDWEINIVRHPKVGHLALQENGAIFLQFPEYYEGKIEAGYEICKISDPSFCSIGKIKFIIQDIGLKDNPEKESIALINGLVGRNQNFEIPEYFNSEGRQLLPEVVIFNQSGIKVYESDNYQNNWSGGSNLSNSLVPDGIYFYHFSFNDKKEESGTLIVSNK